ncbi:MAG: DUF2089 family protein [Phycisphaerales bacterium]
MAFNFPNGVPKFPAGVKVEVKPSTPPSRRDGQDHVTFEPTTSSGPGDPHPLAALRREDQDLIVQLVLHSGSLKDLATTYDVSYPTIRNRLDKVIERLRVIVAGRKPNGVSELLAQMVERGEISSASAEMIGDVFRKQTAMS